MFDTIIEGRLAMMGDEPQKAIVKAAVRPETLTEEDAYIMRQFFLVHMTLFTRNAVMEDLGVFSGGWRRVSGLDIEFGTEIGRRWLSLSSREAVREDGSESIRFSGIDQQFSDVLRRGRATQ